MNKFKILVLSDLHCISKNEHLDDSRMLFEDHRSDFGNGIIDSVKGLGLDIDLMVCSGDISNKGCSINFNKGWKFLNSAKEELKINELIVCPGNHDHESK